MKIVPNYYNVNVVSNDLIGNGIRYLIIHLAEPIPYTAGQFFLLRIRDKRGDYVERSYSVANFGEKNILEFVIRITPRGHMSELIDNLKTGDSIDIKGPFGQFGFAFLEEPFKRLILISGGVGISPIRGMIQSSFQNGDDFPIQLFYGFRTPDDFLFREELEEYARNDRFSLIKAISDTGYTGDWSGETGFISDCLEKKIFLPKPDTHCFICGPPQMVKATREKLFSLGFKKEQIHVEAW